MGLHNEFKAVLNHMVRRVSKKNFFFLPRIHGWEFTWHNGIGNSCNYTTLWLFSPFFELIKLSPFLSNAQQFTAYPSLHTPFSTTEHYWVNEQWPVAFYTCLKRQIFCLSLFLVAMAPCIPAKKYQPGSNQRPETTQWLNREVWNKELLIYVKWIIMRYKNTLGLEM